jgi:glycosyltransferase involved in cell wall biosynthesis
MRIAIATVQAPFLAGGAELHAAGLRTALEAHGHHVDVVTMPFRFFPPYEVRRAMKIWKDEDFTVLNTVEPERVIALKFPTYFLSHPNKICWLLHQHRAVYDHFDEASASADLLALREEIREADRVHLAECRRVFANSRNVADRLLRYNGLVAEPLYHPPPAADRYWSAPASPFIFFPSRIESNKRQSLLVEASRHLRTPVGIVISGTGGQYGALREQVARDEVGGRVRLLGEISRDEVAAFYANCLAVFYGPQDEDYGYVTLEAMLSSKPVITCTDSGGPLEFVEDHVTGRVVPPDAKALAEVIDELHDRQQLAAILGRAGRERYQALGLSWDKVVGALLAS